MRRRLLADLALGMVVLTFCGALVYVLCRIGAFDEPDPRTWPRIPWPDGGTR
jgi:hypothetical protein